MIVLGAIAIKNVVKPGPSSLNAENCFIVENSEKDEWDLCSKAGKEKEDWITAI